MSAGTLNITIEQGATFSKTLVYKDANGSVINLTGATARAKMRETASSGSPVSFTVTITGTGSSTQINWSLSATETAALTSPWTRVYDLEVELSDGTVRRLLQGSVTISPEVTY